MSKTTILMALCGVCGSAGVAVAQPYFVRGEFNEWTNAEPMIEIAPNKYEFVVPFVWAATEFEFKATLDDWTLSAPGSNAKAAGDANDELHVYLYDTETHNDGWLPEGEWRLGYEDSLMFGWEIIGNMNNWLLDPGDPKLFLTDMGNGLHVATLTLDAGEYEWKFRKQGDWSISIGDNFGNSAGNNTFTLTSTEEITFELDLPGGRWRVTEPASCYADCETSTGVGVLDIFDFLCFQNDFVGGGTYACDCDTSTGLGVCDIFDFLCFQDAFVSGCP